MRNEYGVTLDRNGYAPSLFRHQPGKCFLCGRADRPLQRHEVFHGPYRQKAKALGCWLSICEECHMRAHTDGAIDRGLKRSMQLKAMNAYGWTVDRFRGYFGKNYLGGADEQSV